jgi:hypothetical protein
VIGQEPPDVGERRPPLPYGHQDGCEVVIEQHEIGGLPGDVGAADAHGHPDVGGPEGRSVVHAVPGHGHDVAARAECLGDPELVLGLDTANHDAVAVDQAPECCLVGRQIATVDDPAAGLPQAGLPGDRRGRRSGVPGDHGDRDACLPALGEGQGDAGSWWILERHQTDQVQVPLRVLRVRVVSEGAGPPGDGENP